MFNKGILSSEKPSFFPYGSMNVQKKEGIFGVCIYVLILFLCVRISAQARAIISAFWAKVEGRKGCTSMVLYKLLHNLFFAVHFVQSCFH